MIRLLVFVTSILGTPISAFADILEDASKFTVRIRKSIEYSFAKDDAGTSHGAEFLVDVYNRYLDYSQLFTLNSIQNCRKRSLFPMEMD